MSSPQYPESAEHILTTLTKVFGKQGPPEIATLMESAQAEIKECGWDNWNGGMTLWQLCLRVPQTQFALNNERLKEIEDAIRRKLDYLGKLHQEDWINSVVITPSATIIESVRKDNPSDAQVKHIWGEGSLRLFISHLSTNKKEAAELKAALAQFEVAAFVAHEDIEPTRKWQGEIELALNSMHALVALVTPGFHESKWTNQEIGWALGRGLLILPVKSGADPEGFIGSVQALSRSALGITGTTACLLQILSDHIATRDQTRRSIVTAFCRAISYNRATVICAHLEKLTD